MVLPGPIRLVATQWYSVPSRGTSSAVTFSASLPSASTEAKSMAVPSLNQVTLGVGVPVAGHGKTKLTVTPPASS